MRLTVAEGEGRLAELVRRAAAGEEVVIEAWDGAAVRLCPERTARRPSQARGREQALAAAGDCAPYEP